MGLCGFGRCSVKTAAASEIHKLDSLADNQGLLSMWTLKAPQLTAPFVNSPQNNVMLRQQVYARSYIQL